MHLLVELKPIMEQVELLTNRCLYMALEITANLLQIDCILPYLSSSTLRIVTITVANERDNNFV